MLRSLTALFLAGPLACPLVAGAQAFGHKDWSLVCDNTRHCQAAGYQPMDDASGAVPDPVSLVFRRAAGPGTALRASLLAQGADGGSAGGPFTISAGGRSVAGIVADRELSAAQVRALLPALAGAATAQVSAGKQRWTLSLAGMQAVLLKMDDWQGRIDTPGALARKGVRPEASALPPLPPPLLTPAPLARALRTDAALLPAVLAAMPASPDCDAGTDGAALFRLSPHTLLVLRPCARYAYQSGYTVWTAHAAPPHAPVRLQLPMPPRGKAGTGETMAEVMEAFYDQKGVLSSYSKARGPGDCGEAYRWLWTADGFALLSATEAPACRGMPGGVHFPVWVARIAGPA